MSPFFFSFGLSLVFVFFSLLLLFSIISMTSVTLALDDLEGKSRLENGYFSDIFLSSFLLSLISFSFSPLTPFFLLPSSFFFLLSSFSFLYSPFSLKYQDLKKGPHKSSQIMSVLSDEDRYSATRFARFDQWYDTISHLTFEVIYLFIYLFIYYKKE